MIVKASKPPSHAIVTEHLRGNAKRLRREMTAAERKFWQAVRAQRLEGFLFRRQVPIAGCIADFACHERRLVVEIDGATHGTEAELARDRNRTRKLNAEGYKVVRLWNDDVMRNLPLILDQLLDELQRRNSLGRLGSIDDSATLSPSPLVGEGRGEG